MSKISFEWDDGNKLKSLIKHRVTNKEAESCFYSKENLVYISDVQKDGEIRYVRVAISFLGRLITNVYVEKIDCTRIISSRHSNEKETRKYKQKYPD